MSDKETTLRELGFGASIADSRNQLENETAFASSFSGYGEFTPISISTKTDTQYANLERSKSGNRGN